MDRQIILKNRKEAVEWLIKWVGIHPSISVIQEAGLEILFLITLAGRTIQLEVFQKLYNTKASTAQLVIAGYKGN